MNATLDEPLGLAALARVAGVKKVTVWRWITRGCRVAGRTVYLDADRVGGVWKSDRRRLRAFLQRCKDSAYGA